MAKSRLSTEFQEQLSNAAFDALTTPVAKTSLIPETPQSKPKLAKNAPKARMTVQLDEGVLECAKNAVYWTRSTLAKLTEDALKEAIKRLEKERKEAFPKRQAELRVGRPLND